MEWIHKNIKIWVDTSGLFCYEVDDKLYQCSALIDAKIDIEKKTKAYYNFTNKDISTLLKKLNKREAEFVKAIMYELDSHKESAYCEQGVNIDFNYDYKH
jgi:hypothetical protein